MEGTGTVGVGWVWVSRIPTTWKEVAARLHFYFIGADGNVRKVTHGIGAEESHEECWKVAVTSVAARIGTSTSMVVSDLRLVLSLGEYVLQAKDIISAEVVDLSGTREPGGHRQ